MGKLLTPGELSDLRELESVDVRALLGHIDALGEIPCIHDWFEGRCVHCLLPSPYGRQSEKDIDFQPLGHFAKKNSVSDSQTDTALPRLDEDHLQTEFDRYFGSPVIARERWEAWQWAIDALRKVTAFDQTASGGAES